MACALRTDGSCASVPLLLRWQVANELVVKVQPDPAIYWKVQNKVPGLRFEVEQARTT